MRRVSTDKSKNTFILETLHNFEFMSSLELLNKRTEWGSEFLIYVMFSIIIYITENENDRSIIIHSECSNYIRC